MSRDKDSSGSGARVAVVTGGATGIGRAVCRALAEKGMRIGVVYNSSESKARALADELGDAFVLRADLADPAQVEAIVKELREVAGRVDMLVNNAGYNRNAPIFTMKLDDYDAVAGLGRGTWYLTKLILRRFMLRSGGRIVNISSVVGHTGNAGQIPYTMVKAGLDAMTRSLAQELRGRDILINSVAPGFIETDMTAPLGDTRKLIEAQTPMGRFGEPDDIAWAAVYLASEESKFVTGQVLSPNGGWHMSQ
jgi:3-oxoacyl-[acyl-carrier protein] reductase